VTNARTPGPAEPEKPRPGSRAEPAGKEIGREAPAAGGEKGAEPREEPRAVELRAEELEELRARAQERDSFLDLLQRTRAEFANYQRRIERDRQLWSQEEVARLIARLIPFVDDVERALDAVREGKDFAAVEHGLELMDRSFRALLIDLGVQPIEAVGAPFDPRLHEAIEQRRSADHPDGTVIAEMRRGYTLGGRVLRPAQVVVSKQTAAVEAEGDESTADRDS
jgi:molecular chaperone GrpE